MDLGSITPATLVVAALGVAALALMVTLVTHLRASRVQARYGTRWADREKDLIAVVTLQSSKIANLRAGVDGISEVTLTLQERQALAVARTGRGSS